MHVQVIQGHVFDRMDVHDAFDRWVRDLAPGAEGWLGTTAGVTADHMFVMLTEFESTEAARRNSHRPEQHEWWTEISKLFTSDVAFRDCPVTGMVLGGPSIDAGFVQIVQGRVSDHARAWAPGGRSVGSRPAVGPARIALAPAVVQLALGHVEPRLRPDFIGAVEAFDPTDDTLTEAAYFTSESAAREGERKPLPAEAAALMQEWQALLEDVRYYDLPEPWLYLPSR